MTENAWPERSWQIRISRAVLQNDGTYKEGVVQGGGVWVGEKYILTCAHVIGEPSQQVYARFTFASEKPILAHVALDWNGWLPEEQGDLALLELEEDPPIKAKPAPLRLGRDAIGRLCDAYGYPKGHEGGVHSAPTINGLARDGWFQLTAQVAHGHPIQKGFSGTGLFEEVTKAVVGIVVAKDLAAEVKGGFAIPLQHAKKAFPRISPWLGWRLSTDEYFNEHWSPSARGVHEGTIPGWYFTGRKNLIATLTDWLENDPPDRKFRVVTGPVGAGKSALLSWICALSDPFLRQQIEKQNPKALEGFEALPALGRISAAIWAHDASFDDIARSLATSLGVPAPHDASPADVLAALREHQLWDATPITVVIDALNEAKEPVRTVNKLLIPLARDLDLRIIVGTRLDDNGQLQDSFRQGAVAYALNESPWFDNRDVFEYVAACLRADFNPRHPTGYRDNPKACEAVASAIADASAGNFLVAGRVARACADEPVVEGNIGNEHIALIRAAVRRLVKENTEQSKYTNSDGYPQPLPTSTKTATMPVHTTEGANAASRISSKRSFLGNKLRPNHMLYPNEALTSGNGHFELVYQDDGNLVLYGPGGPKWSSQTDNMTPGRCIMQDDGNFVVLSSESFPQWASDTAGNPGAHLIVQDDGNLVIYRPDSTAIWSTATDVFSSVDLSGQSVPQPSAEKTRGDIELEIRQGVKPKEYRARVIYAPAGVDASSVFNLDVRGILNTHEELEANILSTAVSSRRIMPSAEKKVQDVGHRLFEALFSKSLYAAYKASQALQPEGQQLRVVLRLDAPELAALPWEMLYDKDAGTYLCRTQPLIRRLPVPEYHSKTLKIKGPLRILGIVSSPRDLPSLDVDSEKRHLTDALATPIRDGRIELVWAPAATWNGLASLLLSGPWHAVHFIGHGDYDVAAGSGTLALEGDDGNGVMTRASDIVDLFSVAEPRPRLVVLNSCLSGRTGETDMFAGVAGALIRSGISAVLAMQFTVSDTAAIAFSRGLYVAVANNRGVDEATRVGRIAILGNQSGSLEWITPVLYLREGSSQLFEIDIDPALLAPSIPKAESPDVVMRLQELATEYNLLRNTDDSPERRRLMTGVVARMLTLCKSSSPEELKNIPSWLHSTGKEGLGARLAAYAVLYVYPDPPLAPSIAQSAITEEPKHRARFSEYWGLRALRRQIILDPEFVDRNTVRLLKLRLAELSPKCDRAHELSRIIGMLSDSTISQSHSSEPGGGEYGW
ncbi:CHAT domain-containing protein [Kocuria sabuli]|uniref:CHAT domain-containing protein n=1 Tax=Kocuria sabuli TaxID=3071448 RepID=UPI0034D75675